MSVSKYGNRKGQFFVENHLPNYAKYINILHPERSVFKYSAQTLLLFILISSDLFHERHLSAQHKPFFRTSISNSSTETAQKTRNKIHFLGISHFFGPSHNPEVVGSSPIPAPIKKDS